MAKAGKSLHTQQYCLYRWQLCMSSREVSQSVEYDRLHLFLPHTIIITNTRNSHPPWITSWTTDVASTKVTSDSYPNIWSVCWITTLSLTSHSVFYVLVRVPVRVLYGILASRSHAFSARLMGYSVRGMRREHEAKPYGGREGQFSILDFSLSEFSILDFSLAWFSILV